jgi:hypothetical protein
MALILNTNITKKKQNHKPYSIVGFKNSFLYNNGQYTCFLFHFNLVFSLSAPFH